MSRPSLYADPVRFVLQLEKKEKRQWDFAAKKAQMSLTALIQSIVRAQLEKPRPWNA